MVLGMVLQFAERRRLTDEERELLDGNGRGENSQFTKRLVGGVGGLMLVGVIYAYFGNPENMEIIRSVCVWSGLPLIIFALGMSYERTSRLTGLIPERAVRAEKFNTIASTIFFIWMIWIMGHVGGELRRERAAQNASVKPCLEQLSTATSAKAIK